MDFVLSKTTEYVQDVLQTLHTV